MAKQLRKKLKEIGRTAVMSAEERLRYILDARTRDLAARPAIENQDGADSGTIQVLVCATGRERIGLPVEAVAEVLPYRNSVPAADPVPGLIGYFGRGGHLVSVVDLGVALGTGDTATDGHLVLLRRTHPRVALRVDRAHGIDAVSPLSSEVATGDGDAIVGQAIVQAGFSGQEGIVSLVDIDRLLRPFLKSTLPLGA